MKLGCVLALLRLPPSGGPQAVGGARRWWVVARQLDQPPAWEVQVFQEFGREWTIELEVDFGKCFKQLCGLSGNVIDKKSYKVVFGVFPFFDSHSLEGSRLPARGLPGTRARSRMVSMRTHEPASGSY